MGAVAVALVHRHGEGVSRFEPDVAPEEKEAICHTFQAKCNSGGPSVTVGASVTVEKRYIEEECQDLKCLIELRFGLVQSQEARPVRWLGKSRSHAMSQHLRSLGHVLPERRGIRRVSGFYVLYQCTVHHTFQSLHGLPALGPLSESVMLGRGTRTPTNNRPHCSLRCRTRSAPFLEGRVRNTSIHVVASVQLARSWPRFCKQTGWTSARIGIIL